MGIPTRGVGIFNQPRGTVYVENYSNGSIRTVDVGCLPEKRAMTGTRANSNSNNTKRGSR